jgi:putative addiction module killer protein
LENLKDFEGVLQITKRVRRLTIGHRGDFSSVGQGVFELRIHFGPGYRVYYAPVGKEIDVLLFGGDKSSQQRDINKAIEYWKDFLEQYNEKN